MKQIVKVTKKDDVYQFELVYEDINILATCTQGKENNHWERVMSHAVRLYLREYPVHRLIHESVTLLSICDFDFQTEREEVLPWFVVAEENEYVFDGITVTEEWNRYRQKLLEVYREESENNPDLGGESILKNILKLGDLSQPVGLKSVESNG